MLTTEWIGQHKRSWFVRVTAQRYHPAVNWNHFHRVRLELQHTNLTFKRFLYNVQGLIA